MKASEVQRELNRLGDTRTAAFLQRFFKTGPGEYGEGDLFRGIRVPVLRKVAKEYQDLAFTEILKLLHSSHHEDRLLALLILVERYSQGDAAIKMRVYHLYMKNIRFINSWDLVDLSAPQIVGAFLADKKRDVLYSLASSKNLWQRRIAIIATFHFIKAGELDETLKIARILLSDGEDLIQKAVGWMLREVGKLNLQAEENFLGRYCQRMPRVMLRYAIEKFPQHKRRRYLEVKPDRIHNLTSSKRLA